MVIYVCAVFRKNLYITAILYFHRLRDGSEPYSPPLVTVIRVLRLHHPFLVFGEPNLLKTTINWASRQTLLYQRCANKKLEGGSSRIQCLVLGSAPSTLQGRTEGLSQIYILQQSHHTRNSWQSHIPSSTML